MTEKVFILSAKKYGFTDQTTGEYRSGVTVHYVRDIKPTVNRNVNLKGCEPIKASFPESEFANIAELPGYYNIDYIISAGTQGRAKFEYEKISSAATTKIS